MTPDLNTTHVGDCLEVMRTWPDNFVQTCITSPPYWGLRDYGVEGQHGLEPTVGAWVARMVEVFDEVRRVLMDDGTLWLNLGDCYANDGKWGGTTSGKHASALHGTIVGRAKRSTGLKPKDLAGLPWRVAFALQEAGWYLRSDIVWSKPAPMPESVKDRPTRSHEYLFLLARSRRYHYDAEAIKEPVTGGANVRGNGVNPKAAPAPAGWAQGSGSHHPRDHAASKNNGRARQGLKTSTKFGHGPGWRNKQNKSFSAAVTGLVEKRNRRTVWEVAAAPFPEAHFATFPPALIEPCVLAGARPGDVVLDPYMGSGTTAMVAQALGRQWIGCELNPEYVAMQRQRTAQSSLTLA